MTGHRLEVADVFHAHQNQFLQRWGHVLSDQQRKVLRDIGRCRTAALALISNDAIAAAMRLLLTTRAATGIVPSVSPRPATAGL
jgi:hypothetical protein